MSSKRELSLKKVVQFPQAVANQFSSFIDEDNVEDLDVIGGILEGARYGWFGSGSYFQVVCLRSGQKIAAAQFASAFRNQTTCITCACEIAVSTGGDGSLFAVGLQVGNCAGLVCIFSVQGSRTLRYIEVDNPVTCLSVVDAGGTLGGPLAAMDGVLAIGSDNGNVIFLDLCRQTCLDALAQGLDFKCEDNWYKCHKVTTSKLNILEAEREIAESNRQHIALVVQGLNQSRNSHDQHAITSFCPISSISAIAIGDSAGRLMLLDLFTFRHLHRSNVPYECGPIQHLAFQEPSDDPKPICFIWAVYKNPKGPMGVLFALSFQQKEPTGTFAYLYQDFQSCWPKFSIILGQPGDESLSCYSIQKTHFQDESEEGVLSICLLSWIGQNGSGLCIFDINQWYKSQMPATAQSSESHNFLTVFPILSGTRDNRTDIIDVRIDPLAINLFSSLQRVEDHFFTDSISFDCIVITKMEAARLQWPGLQVKAISNISHCGPSGLLAPQKLYIDCLSAVLTPLFHEMDYHVDSPIQQQREMLLSIALDYRNGGFLRSCADAWADGSHAGFPDSPVGGMTLSTITEWAWKQALVIKQQAHKLCIPLFDYSGNYLDRKSERLLGHCTFQFKELNILFKYILKTCSKYISPEAITEISSQQSELEIVSEYYQVLQWLLNVGLLPESPMNMKKSFSREKIQVPYPAETLIDLYKKRRRELQNMDFCRNDSVSCGSQLLFIDSLIENECGGDLLRSEWKEENSSGLYPPSSLQLLLRTYLLQNVSVTQKHTLFIYMFLDLANTLDDERYASTVCNFIKFPAVFRISPAVIKTTQAFWHLDHQDYQYTLEQLIDPLSRSRALPTWQHNLLLSSLIAQRCAPEALMVMRAPGPPIPCELQLKVLLDNNMIADAFELQRKWGGNDLLKIFYEGCAKNNKLDSVIRFALLPEEEKIYHEFLLSLKSKRCDDLRVIYYLQRARYVEAATVNNELRKTLNHRNIQSSAQDLPTREILVSAFQNTLPDVTRKLAEWCNKERVFLSSWTQVNRPTPLSVNIIGTSAKHLHTKATLMQTTIEKALDTWTMSTGRGLKRGLDIEDTPFLRTPKANFERNDSNAHLIYPSAVTTSKDQSELKEDIDNVSFATPSKRQKLECPASRQQSTTKYKNTKYSFNHSTGPYDFGRYSPHHRYDNIKFSATEIEQNESISLSTLSSASKTISANVSLNVSLLHTPVIKRQTSRSKFLVTEEQIVQPSILKVRKAIEISSPSCSSPDEGSIGHSSNASVRSIRFADIDVSSSTPKNKLYATLEPIATPHGSKISPIGATTRSALRTKTEILQPQRASDISKESEIKSSPSTGDDIFYSPVSSFESDTKKETDAKILLNKTDQIENEATNVCLKDQGQFSTEGNVNMNVDSSDINMDVQSIVEGSNEQSTRPRKLSDAGPHPRRSLRSVSHKSFKLTEMNTKSPIKKSKDLLNKLTPKSLEVAAKRNKSLSKMVLLANAQKKIHEIDTSCSRVETISTKSSTKRDNEMHIVTSTSTAQDNEIIKQNYTTHETVSIIKQKEDKSLKEEVVMMETESDTNNDMTNEEGRSIQESINISETYDEKKMSSKILPVESKSYSFGSLDTSTEDSLITERRNFYKNALRRNPIGSTRVSDKDKVTTSTKKAAEQRDHTLKISDPREDDLASLKGKTNLKGKESEANLIYSDTSSEDSAITARRNYYKIHSQETAETPTKIVDVLLSDKYNENKGNDNISGSNVSSFLDSSYEDSIIRERRNYYKLHGQCATDTNGKNTQILDGKENEALNVSKENAATLEMSSNKRFEGAVNADDADDKKSSKYETVDKEDSSESDKDEDVIQLSNVTLQIETKSDTEEYLEEDDSKDTSEQHIEIEEEAKEVFSPSSDSCVILDETTSNSDEANENCSDYEVTKRNAAFIASYSSSAVPLSDDSKPSSEESTLEEGSDILNQGYLLDAEEDATCPQKSNEVIDTSKTYEDMEDNNQIDNVDRDSIIYIDDPNITDDLSIEIVDVDDVVETREQTSTSDKIFSSENRLDDATKSNVDKIEIAQVITLEKLSSQVPTTNINNSTDDCMEINEIAVRCPEEIGEKNAIQIEKSSSLSNKTGQNIKASEINNTRNTTQLLPRNSKEDISKTSVTEMVRVLEENNISSMKTKNEKPLTPLRKNSRYALPTPLNTIENKVNDNAACPGKSSETVENEIPANEEKKNESILTPLRRSTRRSLSTDQNTIENKSIQKDTINMGSRKSGEVLEGGTPVKNKSDKIMTPLRRSLRRSLSTDLNLTGNNDQENIDDSRNVINTGLSEQHGTELPSESGSSDTPRKTSRKSISKEKILTPSRRSTRLSECSESPDKTHDDAKSVVSDKSGASTRSSSRRKTTGMQPTVPTIPEEGVYNNESGTEESHVTKQKNTRGRRSQTRSPEEQKKNLIEEYSTQRRLTRHQLSVMERSLEMSKSVNLPRATRSRASSVDQMEDQNQSDSGDDSNVIQNSNRSESSPGGRIRRSSFNKAQRALITPKKRKNSASEMTDDSDVGSVTSTSSRRSNAFKFASPLAVDGELPSDTEESKTSYVFSPPKESYIQNRLSVIQEEDSVLNDTDAGLASTSSKPLRRTRKVSESKSDTSVSSKKSKSSDTPKSKKLKK